MVRTIVLNDGKRIPALGWGNGTGGQEQSGQKAIDLGAVALKEGILHIDTAQVYGTEAETGGAIDKAGMKKADVWVTDKVGWGVKTTKEGVRHSVTTSLAKLKFIPDLMLVHSPFVDDVTKIAELWRYLEDLVEDGTLKGCSLGLSNFRPQDIETIMGMCKIKPVCNQIEYHPYLLSHLQPVIDLQARYGIVTQSYGPLTPLLRHPTGGPIKPILTRIAKRLSEETGKNVDAASVLLLWTVNKGVVAVTTSGNPDNIKKMAATEELRDLSKGEIAEIDEAGRKVHFRYYADHMTKDFPVPNLPEDL